MTSWKRRKRRRKCDTLVRGGHRNGKVIPWRRKRLRRKFDNMKKEDTEKER